MWKKLMEKKIQFWVIVILCFSTILIYNFLTPMLSDDFNYATVVKNANNIGDLFRQEYQQYMNWTGRSPSHILLRLFLYLNSKIVFDIFNSISFTLLTIFMYLNIEHHEKYDVKAYLLIILSIWIFGVSFSETVLWETGACNYLIATTVIMGFMTAFRSFYNMEKQGTCFRIVGMFLLGIWAGWCNENTSGACILFLLILIARRLYTDRKHIQGWMISGLIGNVVGFLIMIAAPGNMVRSGYKKELHSGLIGIASRCLKITLNIKDEFFILLCILIFLTLLLHYQKVYLCKMKNMLLFSFLFAATCYALALAPEAQVRAFFGAGIFLIIACVQAYSDVVDSDALIMAGKRSAVMILLLYMVFSYLENGANLARIYREEQERYEYLQQKADEGVKEVTVPELRPQFASKYSMAYENDIKADKEYWINGGYAGYFGFEWVYGVPRDEWTEY